MAGSPVKLTFLTLPQRWDAAAGTLGLRVLVAPRGNPLEPLVPSAPTFAKGKLVLNAQIIPDLTGMPDPANVTASRPMNVTPPPSAEALYNALAARFTISSTAQPAAPRTANTHIKKLLMPSYTNAFPFEQPRTSNAVTNDSYRCALTDSRRPAKKPVYSTDEVSWGKVIALALRQSLLAEKLGLIYAADVLLPSADFLASGGWVYVDLDPSSDFADAVLANPSLLQRYGARLPALTGTPRSIFAAVQFPVSSVPPSGNYDDIFVEAEEYDDGFARIVHGMQPRRAHILDMDNEGLPPAAEMGIRLAWDDEQLLIWQNRQMTVPALPELPPDSPLGVLNFRVDVREPPDLAWHSLCRGRGELALGGVTIGRFDSELGISVAPLQLDGQKDGVFWLPSYFTPWMGTSLVVTDATLAKLNGTEVNAGVRGVEPVGEDEVPLRYGHTYQFRVRLADVTGGGPTVDEAPINPSPAPIATIPFRRFVAPKPVQITNLSAAPDPAAPQTVYNVVRPLLGYPELVMTGFSNAKQALLDDLPSALADRRKVGVPDPDVVSLQITVEVGTLGLDQQRTSVTDEPFVLLYTTTRDFPAALADPLALTLAFEDVTRIDALRTPPATGALPIPRSRDIRLRLAAIAKTDPGLAYFGSQEARVGPDVVIRTRADGLDERVLFVRDIPANQIRAILLQPDPVPSGLLNAQLLLEGRSTQAPADLAGRLAEHLQLDVSGLTLSGRPGQRVVFGCSNGLRHLLAPDHSSITFASKADLTRHWILVLRLDLDRDWTWDALADSGFTVLRDGGEVVGRIELRRSINMAALEGADRSRTTLFFFDALDPKPVPPAFPGELDVSYAITPIFSVPPTQQDPPLTLKTHLPISVAPTQTPKLVSAGIALSTYKRSPNYASTDPRQRALWLEFAEPLENERDRYFARVLTYAPDPMLISGGEPVTPTEEPPLPIDPELTRVIVPDQSDDRAGLAAMQELFPSDSPRHFLLPLPPGVSPDSRELFGFYVYELRVGHRVGWSTAQGRFGPPLRVTGVQHPAPLMQCEVGRLPSGITASAPYANPVFAGRSLLPAFPSSEIWVLLYSQVTQVDGNGQRNILLGRKPARNNRDDFQFRTGYGDTEIYVTAMWDQSEIEAMLRALALDLESPMSVLAVELLPEQGRIADPLGIGLGQARILRTSPLTTVPMVCAVL
jgi:hypothetical protein